MSKKKLVIGVDGGFSEAYKKFLERKYILDIHTFGSLYDAYKSGKHVTIPDLLLFTGGADVHPSLYGESVGSHTGVDKERDREEKAIFDLFHRTPKLGICRGSQFLTVMSKGKLVQHVKGHAIGDTHGVELTDTSAGYAEIKMTSTHHQMMFPFNLQKSRYKIIGYSSYFRSDTYLNGEDKEIKLPAGFVEPEIVYYPNSRSLAIQGHPEMSTCGSTAKSVCLRLIEKYLVKSDY